MINLPQSINELTPGMKLIIHTDSDSHEVIYTGKMMLGEYTFITATYQNKPVLFNVRHIVGMAIMGNP